MSSFQNKMYNYEVTPPADTWDTVAAALDEASSENKFPSKLHDMEVAPPAGAWEAISNSLRPAEDKVVPMKRRSPIIFRYAAAAVFIGVVALGIIKWTGTANKSRGTAKAASSKDSNNVNENDIIAPEENEIANVTNEENQANDNTVAKLNRSAKNAIRSVSNKTAYKANRSSANESINPLYTYEDDVADIADRYIVLMTPDGNIIRMSKKLSGLVCCVSGEEQDEECKSQIKKWQKKIATSPINPSPGNFMDLLDLVNSLDEGVEL